MTQTGAKVPRTSMQFSLKHFFLWFLALACACTLGRINYKYEPYLGDMSHLLFLLTLVALGTICGGIAGHAIFRRAGAIIRAILGLVIIFFAFMVSISLN